MEKHSKSNFYEKYQHIKVDEASDEIKELLKEVQGNCESILYFEGNIAIEYLDYFFIKEFKEKEGLSFDFIVVNGDLTVEGGIDLFEYYPGLIVSGFTKAKILVGGDCEIYIKDGKFDYYVCGHHNDGVLATGKVDTQFVINSGHALEVTSDNAIFINAYSDHGDGYDYYFSDIPDNFVAEVLDENGDLDMDMVEFYSLLSKGKNVLKPNAKTSKQRVLEEVSNTDENVEELILKDKKLTAFPEDVLGLTSLKRLDLSGNSIKTIPTNIKDLEHLEELYLSNCKLDSLPVEILNLSKLKVLDVKRNCSVYEKRSIEVPEQIGRLKNLETLDVSDNSYEIGVDEKAYRIFFSGLKLPDSIGELSNLKTLINDQNPVDLPASITKLKKLEKIQMQGSSRVWSRHFPKHISEIDNLKNLDISCNPLDEIPQSILNLKNLEELNLDGSLGYLEGPVADLSKLPKLRVLGFSGSAWGKTGAQVPDYGILRQLFTMELDNLEELRIDSWGEVKGRESAKPEDFSGIGKFKNLKVLDLSFCRLQSLPEDFFELKNLETVILKFNFIPKEQMERLKANCPNVEIQ